MLLISVLVCVLGCAVKKPTSTSKPAERMRYMSTPTGPVTVAEEIRPDYLEYATVDGMRLLWNSPTIDPRPLVAGKPVVLVCKTTLGQFMCLQFDDQLFRSWPSVKVGPNLSSGEGECWCQYSIRPPAIYGDVNQDGNLNLGDIIMVSSCQAIVSEDVAPECWVCDLDRNGSVDAADTKLVRGAQR
jgi:hypothetical protein